ncbi:ATP-binding cassette domain-containing protein [Oscillibacter sp.]|uniref:ABC transporter ATP-binding protein n=1 Tax=Oscillibacter sp. TaxID=1945593 RepID=UPI003397D452
MPETKTPVLETRKLGITFGGLKAVQDFNIQIYQGELMGLIGPNGAGKTTVFNMLTGVYVPTEGTVILNGVPLNGRKTHQFVEAGVARTFQNIRLFKEMSVIDNVKAAFTKDVKYNMLDATFRTPKFWKAEREMTEKALELLTIFHMEDKAELLSANLPYGQQRKLEIARALATNMKVLLLDEPAAGMNPTETAELLECINTIRDRFGIAILLIEHDMSLVMNICERIQVIDYGQTIAAGLPEEIARNPKVIAAYLGE